MELDCMFVQKISFKSSRIKNLNNNLFVSHETNKKYQCFLLYSSDVVLDCELELRTRQIKAGNGILFPHEL
jgi:hypothetical protein